MTINTSSFHSDLLPGVIKKWFSVNPTDLAPIYNRMMKVENSDQRYEIHSTLTGMGSAVLVGEGNALTLDSAIEAYKPRYEHLNYALGFAITKNMLRDGTAFGNAKKFTAMLKRAMMVTKEIVASNVINFAGTSGYTMPGGDGVILASASHPTAAGNQSNILSGGADLSEAALEALRVQILNAKDNRGLRQRLFIKDLIINPAQEALAHRILKSKVQIDTLNNANFLNDTAVVKGIIVNPYLTSTTQWQVTTTHEDGLKFLVRQEPEMDMDNEFMTKNGLYSADMRISAGWDDFRGLYISL